MPYIGGGEEEKIETETRKLLGRFENGAIKPRGLRRQRADDEGARAGRTYRGHVDRPRLEPVDRGAQGGARFIQRRAADARLPTAPVKPIVLHTAEDRPQPRLDVAFGRGMPVHVGRVRRCPMLGYKLVAMGHNVVRGAAGAALLNAELMVARLRAAGAEADLERKTFAPVR